MEQKALSKWLKLILIGIGICGIVTYFYLVPYFGNTIVQEYPEFANRYWPWLVFLWVSGIPCYAVLVMGWKVASNIGKDRSFSYDNANYLKWVAWLAAGNSVYFFVGNLVLLILNMSHPGVALLSLFIVFVGVSVTVAAGALSHLVQKAAALQEQSDFTI